MTAELAPNLYVVPKSPRYKEALTVIPPTEPDLDLDLKSELENYREKLITECALVPNEPEEISRAWVKHVVLDVKGSALSVPDTLMKNVAKFVPESITADNLSSVRFSVNDVALDFKKKSRQYSLVLNLDRGTIGIPGESNYDDDYQFRNGYEEFENIHLLGKNHLPVVHDISRMMSQTYVISGREKKWTVYYM